MANSAIREFLSKLEPEDVATLFASMRNTMPVGLAVASSSLNKPELEFQAAREAERKRAMDAELKFMAEALPQAYKKRMSAIPESKAELYVPFAPAWAKEPFVLAPERSSKIPKAEGGEVTVPDMGDGGQMIPSPTPYRQGGLARFAKGNLVNVEDLLKAGKATKAAPTSPLKLLADPLAQQSTLERELTGALAPAVTPVRGQTSKELMRQQKRVLTDEQNEKLQGLIQQYPGFDKAVQYMTPQELVKTLGNPTGVKEITRLLEVLPDAKQLSAVAKAGGEKQGWYRASTQAIIDVFGIDDAPRFAALLAAQSPQTSVEMNLKNALNTWKNWTAAGRPTDAREIKSIMGKSVAGTKGEQSVLDAWVNNSVRALSTEDPTKIVLSGPKVDSFFRNLADDVYRVTNDAWMSNGLRVVQSSFSGSPTELQLLRGDPGLSPGYIATNARIRQAAQRAGMFPSEGQETMWSFFMPLMEQQTATGMPAREILQKGLLTPEMIRGTPDFATLLKQGDYGRILEEAGYGEKLESLQPTGFRKPNYSLTSSEQRDIEDVVQNLENLGRMRQSGRRFTLLGTKDEPATSFATKHQEYIPGRGTGHFEELIDAPEGIRSRFSSQMSGAFQDPQNRNILMQAAGFEPLETARFAGSFRPPGGIPFAGPRAETGLREATEARFPVEQQPGFASTVELPVKYGKKGPQLSQADIDALNAVATVEGGMTAQLGTPYTVPIPTRGGESLLIRSDKRIPDESLRYLGGIMDPGTEAIADTGRGSMVLNWGQPFDVATKGRLGEALGGEPVSATNLGNYIDLSSEFAQPAGSGAVARRMVEATEKLPARRRAALSEAAKQPAGDIFDIYQGLKEKGGVPREDLMNLLDVIRKYGIAGIPAALASGAALAEEEPTSALQRAAAAMPSSR